jgi:hypothetical protein
MLFFLEQATGKRKNSLRVAKKSSDQQKLKR